MIALDCPTREQFVHFPAAAPSGRRWFGPPMKLVHPEPLCRVNTGIESKNRSAKLSSRQNEWFFHGLASSLRLQSEPTRFRLLPSLSEISKWHGSEGEEAFDLLRLARPFQGESKSGLGWVIGYREVLLCRGRRAVEKKLLAGRNEFSSRHRQHEVGSFEQDRSHLFAR